MYIASCPCDINWYFIDVAFPSKVFTYEAMRGVTVGNFWAIGGSNTINSRAYPRG